MGAVTENFEGPDDLRARQAEIKRELERIDGEYRGQALPDAERESWNALNSEYDELDAQLTELETREARMQQLAAKPENVEPVEPPFQMRRPSATRTSDIWDLTTIRAAGGPDEIRAEVHDRCKRAIEQAFFPHPQVRNEDAQAHVERLLMYDNATCELGYLIMRTGSPTYRKAFAKWAMGKTLDPDESRAFSLSTTGIPIPYVLDPTVIPISNSVVNPLRAISNVEQIVGSNQWRGVTAAAITASRVSEATEATDNTPTLAQPTIDCSKVHAFVPFSIESGQDWSALEANMSRLFSDAKDDEEATAFATGNGTPPNPFGVLTGATGTTAAATGLTITAANLYSLEAALAPRFRPRAQFVANRAMYNIIRALDTAGGAQLWLRIGELIGNAPASSGGNGNTGLRLLGYAVNELSTMSATVVNGTKIMLLGDFSMFKIIDRVGMTVELVPHIFGAGNRYPIGQRGLYAYWRNGSKVIDAAGFRALTGTT
jgi:HK97 family phage major capsid protein